MKEVIWADDDTGFMKDITYILSVCCKKRGIEFNFTQVSSGEKLVEKVRQGPIDIVFTDNQMGAMSGLDAVSSIRQFNSKIPIYVVSTNKGIEEKALKVGATGYINKSQEPWTKALEIIASLGY